MTAGFPSGVLWLKYRCDGQTSTQRLSPGHAKANLRFFSASVANWEIKDDIADHFGGHPLEFAEGMSRVDRLLDDLCGTHDVHYVNVDVFSSAGLQRLLSATEAASLGRERLLDSR